MTLEQSYIIVMTKYALINKIYPSIFLILTIARIVSGEDIFDRPMLRIIKKREHAKVQPFSVLCV